MLGFECVSPPFMNFQIRFLSLICLLQLIRYVFPQALDRSLPFSGLRPVVTKLLGLKVFLLGTTGESITLEMDQSSALLKWCFQQGTQLRIGSV